MAEGDTGVQIDMQEILRRIPHRYPFLLIDRAEDFIPNQSIVGIKGVTANEPFFPGHFPDNPVMPGVLIVEALAQAGAVLMSKSLDIDATGRTIFLASTDNVRFRSAVRPGVLLRLHVEVLRHRGDVYKFKGAARIEGRDAAEAEWTAMVVDNPA
jgi:3-hydroxyacyl-[acyl-carrier-protein] dehydratase